MSRVVDWLKQQANRAKIEVYAIFLAYRDPRVPWYARALAACVAGYAFSPIDLIPDFIPVLGSLDDLLLVPVGIALALRMIPQPVMAECREKARLAMQPGKPVNWVAAGIIVLVWLVLAALGVELMMLAVRGR